MYVHVSRQKLARSYHSIIESNAFIRSASTSLLKQRDTPVLCFVAKQSAMNQQVLEIVVAQLTMSKGDGCLCMHRRTCPDRWFHEATAVCHSCETQVDMREEHVAECAQRCVAMLMMTTRSPHLSVYPLSTSGHETWAHLRRRYEESMRIREDVETEPNFIDMSRLSDEW